MPPEPAPEPAPVPQNASSISVAVDPVALVVTECIAVTAAMRKHARWAHSSVSAILGASSHKTPAIPRRDRSGQGVISAGEQEDAVPSRWGLRGKKGKSMQDNPLMAAFARLRSNLKGCKGALNWSPQLQISANIQ
jgi:brefeldin A-resistance guanine nucleotide exchange factor 1